LANRNAIVCSTARVWYRGGVLVEGLLNVWRRVWRFLDVMSGHNAFEGASAIAFWFFLSLVPLLVFIGWLLGTIARSKGVDFLAQPALELVPGPAAEALIRKELERMSSGGGSASIAPISVVGFLWTSSSGLHNLMDIFEIAVKVERRPWWKQRALALAWLVLGLVAISATAWTLVQLDASMHSAERASVTAPSAEPSAPIVRPSAAGDARDGRGRAAHEPSSGKRGKLRQRVAKMLHTPWEQTLAGLVMLAIGTTFLAGFYRFAVEHPANVRRRAWPGAFVAVLTWLVVSWVFGAYVSSLGDYALYYGGLAAVAVILIWLYLTSLALVLGAEVNAQLEGVRG